MFLTDNGGAIVTANSAALRLIGRQLRDVRGKRIETVLTLRRHPAHMTAKRPRDLQTAGGYVCILEQPNRTTITVLLKKTRSAAGKTLWVLRDVSRAQSMMHALDQKTRLFLEAERVGRMGGWEYDPTSQVITWTRELQRLMGVRDEIMSVEQSNSFYTGMSRDIVREAFKATVAAGTPYDLELEVVTGDGRRLWIREVCRPTFRRGKLISVVGVVQDISEGRRMAALLTQSADQERTRIAADLHDGVGQELTGLALELEGSASEYRHASPAAARNFALCSAIARRALTGLRETSHALLPLELRDLGFIGVCRRLASSAGRTLEVRVQFRFRGDHTHVPVDSTAEHLYRIGQEALANAIRHGAARRITMALTANESKLQFTISDNGSGISPAAENAGVGLQLMRYRAGLIGGLLTLKRRREGGTHVRCVVPRSAIDARQPRLDTRPRKHAVP